MTEDKRTRSQGENKGENKGGNFRSGRDDTRPRRRGAQRPGNVGTQSHATLSSQTPRLTSQEATSSAGALKKEFSQQYTGDDEGVDLHKDAARQGLLSLAEAMIEVAHQNALESIEVSEKLAKTKTLAQVGDIQSTFVRSMMARNNEALRKFHEFCVREGVAMSSPYSDQIRRLGEILTPSHTKK